MPISPTQWSLCHILTFSHQDDRVGCRNIYTLQIIVLVLIIGQLCTATPCENGGTCLETDKSRTCDCVAGYTGNDCETGGKLFMVEH